MAVYATLTELAAAATGGWAELAQHASADPDVSGELMQLTAEGGDRSAWSAELQAAADAGLAVLQDVLERTSRHADTHLYPRYRQHMPLSEDLVRGSSLPEVVAAIAVKRLYGAQVPEDVRRGVQWAEDYLVGLAKGTVSLGAADVQVAQPSGRMSVRAPGKAFDWERY